MEAIDTAGSVELMERFVGKLYRDAAASILAGSRARGDARSTSDYDLVLLYETIPSAWRGMQEFEGAHVECFAHDPGTLQYFLDEIELPSAEPALARMVVEGSVVTGEGSLVLEKAHKAAATLLRNGPPSWTTPKIDAARYRITDWRK